MKSTCDITNCESRCFFVLFFREPQEMTELRELSDLLDKEYEIKHLERLTGRHKPLQHISTVDITSGSVH